MAIRLFRVLSLVFFLALSPPFSTAAARSTVQSALHSRSTAESMGSAVGTATDGGLLLAGGRRGLKYVEGGSEEGGEEGEEFDDGEIVGNGRRTKRHKRRRRRRGVGGRLRLRRNEAEEEGGGDDIEGKSERMLRRVRGRGSLGGGRLRGGANDEGVKGNEVESGEEGARLRRRSLRRRRRRAGADDFGGDRGVNRLGGKSRHGVLRSRVLGNGSGGDDDPVVGEKKMMEEIAQLAKVGEEKGADAGKRERGEGSKKEGEKAEEETGGEVGEIGNERDGKKGGSDYKEFHDGEETSRKDAAEEVDKRKEEGGNEGEESEEQEGKKTGGSENVDLLHTGTKEKDESLQAVVEAEKVVKELKLDAGASQGDGSEESVDLAFAEDSKSILAVHEDSGNSGVAEEMALMYGGKAEGRRRKVERNTDSTEEADMLFVKLSEKERMDIEAAAHADDESYVSFMVEMMDIKEKLNPTLQGLKAKAAKHVIPHLARLAKSGRAAFSHTSKSLYHQLSPYVGSTFSPVVATLLSYSLLFIPLGLILLLVNKIRVIFSLHKLLLLCNLYLMLYCFALLAACVLINGEPMAGLQVVAESNYFVLQLLQCFGYIWYLGLQFLSFCITSKNRVRDPLSLANSALHFLASLAIGLHYYVTVFERAMLDKVPHTGALAYFVYCVVFLYLTITSQPRTKVVDKQK